MTAPDGAGPAAFMVVRAWRDGPGGSGVRARIWQATGSTADLTCFERVTASFEDLERAVQDWLDGLGDEEWGGQEWGGAHGEHRPHLRSVRRSKP